ncbi:hypothetical protein QWT87_01180 [Chryseobacterium sp. APV1]|uniref:Glycosyl-4,4'-diaponeurosporenoate acyltransferase n=1 Tax=Chryseobacterium urinae TaxID=3058400 RepID=A0ABT8TXF9_9FLAO|nr:hypothetical protein [Chryseobacterium sp. APV1]MDO3423480.1 hypothetical protein [Chryseobacterium sp. APV1]
MQNEVNLKSKNTTLLWVFLAANIIIILTLIFPKFLEKFDVLLWTKTIGASIAPIILFLLNGLLSSHQKAIIIFWKLQDPLPGSMAFSELSKKDSRIDAKQLKNTFGNLPKKPSEQNKLWYKIYRKNSTNAVVVGSHRAFLLARDLTSLSFLLMFCMGALALFFIQPVYKYYYMLFLIMQYFANLINARNRGKRFVTNVLAVESTVL